MTKAEMERMVRHGRARWVDERTIVFLTTGVQVRAIPDAPRLPVDPPKC